MQQNDIKDVTKIVNQIHQDTIDNEMDLNAWRTAEIERINTAIDALTALSYDSLHTKQAVINDLATRKYRLISYNAEANVRIERLQNAITRNI